MPFAGCVPYARQSDAINLQSMNGRARTDPKNTFDTYFDLFAADIRYASSAPQ
jgi:hypothetical protein